MKKILSIFEGYLNVNNETDLQNLLHNILKSAKSAYGLKGGAIHVLKGEFSRETLLIEEGDISTKKMAINNEVSLPTETFIDKSTELTTIYSPIFYSDRVIGVLSLCRDKNKGFSKTDAKNVEIIAKIVGIFIAHSELNKKVEESFKKIYLLYEIGRELNKTLDLEKLLHTVVSLVKNVFSFDNVAILLKEKHSNILKIRKASEGFDKKIIKNFKVNIDKGEGITGAAARFRKTVISNDIESDERYIRGTKDTKSEMAIPLISRGKFLGVLDIESKVKNRFSEEDRKILETLAAEIAIAIDNALLYEEMKTLAEKDELTGLYNYRVFRRELNKEVSRALRYKKIFSLAMFDIDFFKSYNDNNGHDVGNEALKRIGRIILQNSRSMDLPARFGGEEFIVILPETSKSDAFVYAERIRKIIESEKFPGEEKQPNGKLTVSGGVAEFPVDGNTAEKIIKSVDIAAYKAKESGRNRIVIYSNGGDKK